MGIITVNKLERTYISHKRGEGFKEAFNSLFAREAIFSYAVKKISFSIDEGEIIGFIGPNGAGKSTTIKMLTGILYPTGGEATVLGFAPWKQRREYVKHIGVVFGQKSQLWWDLPPIDSFHLIKTIYSIPDKEYHERLHAMSKMLRVEEIINKPTRDLSLGERMKCEFIMALLYQPKILFLDEPTIGVDALAKEEIRDFLQEINKKHKTTIILTTHDMDDIEELCKRIIIIDNGSIIYDGNLKNVKEKYVKQKTIDIEFTKIKKSTQFNALLKKGKIIDRRKNSLSAQFTAQETPVIVKQFMACCDVIDLLVHEPALEDVIKEIYREQK